MSRKRESKRESRRELARQLGVPKDEVPDALRAHARVSEPEIKVRFAVERVKRGLLTRPKPMVVDLALYVGDASGVRVARAQSFQALVPRAPADVSFERTLRGPDEAVRYTRPGRFTLVALVSEGADDASLAHSRAALLDVRVVHLVVAGTPSSLMDPVVARLESPTALEVRFGAEPALHTARALFVAMAAVTVPAAHRVHETVRLPIRTADERLVGTLVVDLRV